MSSSVESGLSSTRARQLVIVGPDIEPKSSPAPTHARSSLGLGSIRPGTEYPTIAQPEFQVYLEDFILKLGM